MTLAEWCDTAETRPEKCAGGTLVYANERTKGFIDLWRLSDFAVSSRSGPVIWLVPASRLND